MDGQVFVERADGAADGYKERFKINDVYTPQMVVDGATQFNGSDAQGRGAGD